MRLQNIRHEKSAQLIASGAIASKAYEEAGFIPNGAAQGAERLAGRGCKVSSVIRLFTI